MASSSLGPKFVLPLSPPSPYRPLSLELSLLPMALFTPLDGPPPPPPLDVFYRPAKVVHVGGSSRLKGSSLRSVVRPLEKREDGMTHEEETRGGRERGFPMLDDGVR